MKRATTILVALLACSAVARADEAPVLFKRGVGALRAKDYASAATAFQQSYALSPKAATMCNLALTYDRWDGHVAEAIEAYRKCAEDDESGRFRDHALERARQLREQLAASPPPPVAAPKPEPPVEHERPSEPPVATPPPTAPSPAAPPVAGSRDAEPRAVTSPVAEPPPVAAPPVAAVQTTAPRPTRPFRRDPAACTMLAFGVVGIATGSILALAANAVDGDIATTVDIGQKAAIYNRGASLYTGGFVALGLGVALVVGSVIEWAAHGRYVVRK